GHRDDREAQPGEDLGPTVGHHRHAVGEAEPEREEGAGRHGAVEAPRRFGSRGRGAGLDGRVAAARRSGPAATMSRPAAADGDDTVPAAADLTGDARRVLEAAWRPAGYTAPNPSTYPWQ